MPLSASEWLTRFGEKGSMWFIESPKPPGFTRCEWKSMSSSARSFAVRIANGCANDVFNTYADLIADQIFNVITNAFPDRVADLLAGAVAVTGVENVDGAPLSGAISDDVRSGVGKNGAGAETTPVLCRKGQHEQADTNRCRRTSCMEPPLR